MSASDWATRTRRQPGAWDRAGSDWARRRRRVAARQATAGDQLFRVASSGHGLQDSGGVVAGGGRQDHPRSSYSSGGGAVASSVDCRRLRSPMTAILAALSSSLLPLQNPRGLVVRRRLKRVAVVDRARGGRRFQTATEGNSGGQRGRGRRRWTPVHLLFLSKSKFARFG